VAVGGVAWSRAISIECCCLTGGIRGGVRVEQSLYQLRHLGFSFLLQVIKRSDRFDRRSV
jgi:hypothetical protein